MRLIVSGIRLPFEQADASALEPARRQPRPGGWPGRPAARIYKRSLDLRHGKLSKVFSVLLDLPAALEERDLMQTQGRKGLSGRQRRLCELVCPRQRGG